jgi:hypothetical protein
MSLTCLQGRYTGVNNWRGGIKVRFASFKVHDASTLRFQFFGASEHFYHSKRFYVAHPLGKLGHIGLK